VRVICRVNRTLTSTTGVQICLQRPVEMLSSAIDVFRRMAALGNKQSFASSRYTGRLIFGGD
jgi:hypothetical protein